MNASPTNAGDLGEFIVTELRKRGISFPRPIETSPLPAAWRTWTIELEGTGTGLAVAAQGCSLEKVAAFLFQLFSPLRVYRPFSNDDDNSFWFNICGNEGSFRRAEKGVTVLFLTREFSLAVFENDQGLAVGFSKHPTDSGSPAPMA